MAHDGRTMKAVWQCPACFALSWHGEAHCARCGTAPGPFVAGGREAETEPVVLGLPPIDFPYTRTHRTPADARAWVAPLFFLTLSVAVALGWDSVARAVDPAHALGGSSDAAQSARRAELDEAGQQLARLLDAREAAIGTASSAGLEDWRPAVLAVGARYHIDGDQGRPGDLADAEMRMRAALLELASLPEPAGPNGADLRPRVAAARDELSHVSEELSHAP